MSATPFVATWPTVCLTGHRPQHLRPDACDWLRHELDRTVARLVRHHGLADGISGMAIGADLWWADSLVRAGVRLHAHVPFPQQSDKWSPQQRADWERLCRVAWKMKTYGGHYDVKTLHARNDGMLQSSDAVVAAWIRGKNTGGTASAVLKAIRRGLPVIHIDPGTQRVATLLDEPTRRAIECELGSRAGEAVRVAS